MSDKPPAQYRIRKYRGVVPTPTPWLVYRNIGLAVPGEGWLYSAVRAHATHAEALADVTTRSEGDRR